jgi:hypothetical protein
MNPFLVHFIERTGTPKNGAGGAELVDDRGPRGGGEPLGQTVKKLEKIENSQEMCTETYHIFDSNATPPVGCHDQAIPIRWEEGWPHVKFPLFQSVMTSNRLLPPVLMTAMCVCA